MKPTSKWHFVSGLPSGSPKIPKLGTPTTLRAHNFLCKPLIDMKCKASCTSHWELSNGMWHATCTQGNRDDSRLLVVGNQIANLTFDTSFDHNLCFRCSNGSCKPILDIYVPRAFQWYKKRFNPMSFDPWNCSLKIQKSTRIPTPKVGVPLGLWGFIPSHSFALPGAWNVTPGIPSWPALLQALALVVNPRLGLWHSHYMIKLYSCSILVARLATCDSNMIGVLFIISIARLIGCWMNWKITQLQMHWITLFFSIISKVWKLTSSLRI